MTKLEEEIFTKMARAKVAELLKIEGEYSERATFLANQLSETIDKISRLEFFYEAGV